jgi:hypothetical protein
MLRIASDSVCSLQKHRSSCYVHFEVVDWKRGNERTERQTQKIETVCLEGPLSRAPGGARRKRGRGPVAQRTTRTALDRIGSGKLWERNPVGDDGGQGSATKLSASEASQEIVFRVSKGDGGAASRHWIGCRLSAVWCVETLKQCRPAIRARNRPAAPSRRSAVHLKYWGATEQNAELRILLHCSPIPKLRRAGGYRPGPVSI